MESHDTLGSIPDSHLDSDRSGLARVLSGAYRPLFHREILSRLSPHLGPNCSLVLSRVWKVFGQMENTLLDLWK